MIDFLKDYVFIITPALAWLISQGSKVIMMASKIKKGGQNNITRRRRLLYVSGGMPSAHSATVVSLLVVIGYCKGVNSSIFGLALLFSAVVMYDAAMVRHASGLQGDAIAALIKEKNSKVKPPKIAYGHTPLEVLIGAIVGALVAAAVIFLIII